MATSILTAGEMKARDAFTFNSVGVDSRAVLEVAGRTIAAAVLEFPEEILQRGIVVVTGGGNNGGDGFVAARALLERGYSVVVLAAVPESELRGDALSACRAWRSSSGRTESSGENDDALLSGAGLIIDALFGTGYSREMNAAHAGLVRSINATAKTRARILSIDVPSGVSADTGAVISEAVRADVTVTLQALKPCFVLPPGREYVGRVVLADIGVSLGQSTPDGNSVTLLEVNTVGQYLHKIRGSSYVHKGTRGHVAIFGGFPGRAGAVVLAAKAALRAGAGLVTAIIPEASIPFIDASLPEVMFEVIPGSAKGEKLERAIAGFLDGKDSIVLGPGLGTSELAEQYFLSCLEAVRKNSLCSVVDADALNLLSKRRGQDLGRLLPSSVVLTPHPGEAGRMLGKSASEIEAVRFASVRQLADTYHGVAVLKGAFTLLAGGGAGISVSPHAHAALATGGSGDVLSGVIAGFIAQGIGAREAAELGVYLHGEAGQVFSRGLMGHGVGALAHEIADWIPALASGLLGISTSSPPTILPGGMLRQVLPPHPLLVSNRGW